MLKAPGTLLTPKGSPRFCLSAQSGLFGHNTMDPTPQLFIRHRPVKISGNPDLTQDDYLRVKWNADTFWC